MKTQFTFHSQLKIILKPNWKQAEWFRALDFNAVTRVQTPLWPLADVVLGSCLVQLLVILVNSQLVCLPPVGILNSVVFICIICFIGPEKSLLGNDQLSIYLSLFILIGQYSYK